MTLVPERATIMPQVSTSLDITSQYPSQVLSLPLMADKNLTLPAANLLRCLRQRGWSFEMKKEVLLEAPF